MFVPSTSETRTKLPEAFTNKARAEVFNNLNNNNNNNNNNINSNGETTSAKDEHTEPTKTKSKTSSILPSFFSSSSRAEKEKSDLRHPPLSPSPTIKSSASSLRSGVYTSALPSYQQLTSPITRTLTNNSIESNSGASIFSSSSLKSISTATTSLAESSSLSPMSSSNTSDKVILPSISNILKSNNNHDNSNSNLHHQNNNSLNSISSYLAVPTSRQRSASVSTTTTTTATVRRSDGKTISLERAISDIKDYNTVSQKNIGYEVFRQLNEAIAEILKSEYLQLIDWNLNLIRCSLIINELPQSWNNEIPEITVNGNKKYKIQDGFQSELVKLISSYRRQQKNYLPTSDINFKKFIRSVMQNRFLVFEKKLDQNNVVIKFNKNIREECIRIQLIPDRCTEEEFIELLANSDLFKEFNLEPDFRRKVATISIKQSKFLQSLKSSSKEELLYPYKILSLRNFFLNLLVASQTLFEFHYTTNELLGKDKKDEETSDQELKWLWDNIRERNFKKIEVFDKFY